MAGLYLKLKGEKARLHMAGLYLKLKGEKKTQAAHGWPVTEA